MPDNTIKFLTALGIPIISRISNGDDSNGIDWKYVLKISAAIISLLLVIIGFLIVAGLNNIQSTLGEVKAITYKTMTEVVRIDQKVNDHIETTQQQRRQDK